MILALLMLVAAPEPGAVPGPDTGFVPPPRAPEKPSKKGDPADTYIAPGAKGESSSKPWEARTPEETGYLYIKKKEPFQALTIFEELLRQNPADVGAKIGKATSLYEIARYYQRRGRFDEAHKAYDDALALDPSFAQDEEFNWHRALIGPTPEQQRRVNVYDPRPRILQNPWIGPHLRFGAQGLVAPGLSIQPLDMLRVEVGFDVIYFGMSAQLIVHMPWQWSPYLNIGGKLSFGYPPLGTGTRKKGFEVWQASFFDVGAGVQYRHPVGLFFTAGVEMLVTGAILPQQTASTSNFVDIVYPFPFPYVTFGWLFGG